MLRLLIFLVSAGVVVGVRDGVTVRRERFNGWGFIERGGFDSDMSARCVVDGMTVGVVLGRRTRGSLADADTDGTADGVLLPL